MTRSDYFRPVRGGISGLCEEADDNPLSNFSQRKNETAKICVRCEIWPFWQGVYIIWKWAGSPRCHNNSSWSLALLYIVQ